MRNRKYFALAGALAVYIVVLACVHYFTEDAEWNRFCNSYGICINEVCSDFFPDSLAGTQLSGDWIELYNFSDDPIDLGNYYLSDDEDDLYKCSLPAVTLLPGSYYVIHSECEEMTGEEGYLNFGIKAAGETLYLSNRIAVIDVVSVPALEINTTWSRLTDAGREWGITERTYCFSNNQAKPVPGKTEEPVFSAECGFYEDEFELELRAPSGGRVYYTLDGSEPDEGSMLYEEPILIRDVSEEPNIYAERNDFDPERIAPPEEPIEKIMIVRAVAIDADGKKSGVVTNSYIVGRENAAWRREMYTVSLVSDPYHLFDREEGIYVLGEKYDDEMSVWEDGAAIKDANYQIRGKRSERPASLEIFDENGTCILEQEVGIRIRGNMTRHCVQKAFSVYAREMYGGSDTIEGIFEEGKAVHKFFLYTNTDPTKLRDVLIAENLSDRNMATQSLRYCNVFLDGEYWGIYLMEEVYDEYYFENRYGIGADNLQIYEGANPPEVLAYLDSVPDKSEKAVYEKLCEMIDVQSFVDYYAAMLYLNNLDWLNYNAKCYRSIEEGPGEKEDGKWRWAVYDIESTMFEPYVDTFHTGLRMSWQADPIAQALMEHEAFRERFIVTYMDLYNTIWREDCIWPYIEEKTDNMAASYEMYTERFQAGVDIDQYHYYLKRFFEQRPEYVFDHLREEFDLSGSPVWLVLLTDQGGEASFRVNTSTVDLPGAWWQGLYFPDYPVEIEVEEVYRGWKFLGWYAENGDLIGSDEKITIDLTEDTNIIYARFTAE